MHSKQKGRIEGVQRRVTGNGVVDCGSCKLFCVKDAAGCVMTETVDTSLFQDIFIFWTYTGRQELNDCDHF